HAGQSPPLTSNASADARLHERDRFGRRSCSRAVAEALDQGAQLEQDGWLRVEIPIESIEHATSELLRLGAEVEVLDPPALRKRIRHIAAQVAAIHARPPAATPRRARRRV